MKQIPVIIVSYRNPVDVLGCLRALQKLEVEPAFDVYICENGGDAAFDALLSMLVDVAGGVCEHCEAPENATPEAMPRFVEVMYLRSREGNARVTIAQARENFGYAGAINSWLRILSAVDSWPGAWILNPDTEPEPLALAELVSCSCARGLGMVGSRVVKLPQDGIVLTRGLHWSPLRATTIAVDRDIAAAIVTDLGELEARLDAVSGVSIYVTRQCLESVGFMDERYFLYFEDLEWGVRAKTKSWKIGYSHESIVAHKGGTTIGSARSRGGASEFSVYLDFRNRVTFVRSHYRLWSLWTVFILALRTLEFGFVGSLPNMRAAFKGLMAGMRGEIGRPDVYANLGSFTGDGNVHRPLKS